jgi:3-oxoacyl-[acyl-carrier protein] reductase
VRASGGPSPRRYAEQGAAVAVADLDPSRAEEAATAVRGAGRPGFALVGDMRSATDVDAVVAGAVEAMGGLDVLVTVVAGQVAFVPAVRIHEMTDDDWDLVTDVNLRHVFRAVRAAIRVLLGQGNGRHDRQRRLGDRLHGRTRAGRLRAAKAGLLSLARTVAAEYAGDRIRMNVVTAGAIRTVVSGAFQPDDGVDEIPLGRYGTVADVADAAVYLGSAESAYVTGQRIVVDGGVSVRGPFS